MPSPAFPLWTEAVCRQCASTDFGQFVKYSRKRTTLRREMLASGWVFKHDDVFCSQACVDRYEQEEKRDHDH